MRRTASVFALLLVVSCGSRDSGDALNLTTVFDSTPDTTFARVSGDFPDAAVRHLVPELSIAPGADDTTLFTQVREFDVDRQGRFWVFDQGSRSLFLFGPDGALLRRIGRQGSGPGEFKRSSGAVVTSGDGLALWDAQNARIAFFDSAGTFTQQWPLPGGFFTPNGLYTDTSGQLYLKRSVTPPREGEILGRLGLVKVHDGGVFGDSLVPPDLPVPREEYIASVEGNTSSTTSSFSPNYYWSWTPTGEFVAANGGTGEIIRERKGRRPLVIRRTMTPVPIAAAERDYEQAHITWNLHFTDPTWRWNGPALPTTKAPIRSLLVSRDGRLWVQVAVASDTIPMAEREVSSDSTQPIAAHRMPVVYEVYAPEGRLLGRVAFPGPGPVTLMEADGNTVWGLAVDADDLPAVMRWRVEPAF